VQADCEAIERGSLRAVGASRGEVPLRNGERARCWSKKESVRISSLRRFDISREQDGEVRRLKAVLAGLGITQAPHWLFAADIRAGTVRRVLRDHEPGKITISAGRPTARRQPSKVAVFIDHCGYEPS
jgi:DNA-binding transcriptional LysR family regulator